MKMGENTRGSHFTKLSMKIRPNFQQVQSSFRKFVPQWELVRSNGDNDVLVKVSTREREGRKSITQEKDG